LRGLRRAELITRGNQPVERRPVAPVELVGDPRGNRRLGEGFYALGRFRIALFFQLCGEGISRSRELGQWNLKKLIDLVGRLFHH